MAKKAQRISENMVARPLLLQAEALHVRIEKLQYCLAPHQSASL